MEFWNKDSDTKTYMYKISYKILNNKSLMESRLFPNKLQEKQDKISKEMRMQENNHKGLKIFRISEKAKSFQMASNIPKFTLIFPLFSTT